MRLARSAVVLVLLALTGCLSNRAMLADPVERGRPEADPGADAYLVWRDADGWHLRARSDVPRRFHGVIEAGLFVKVRPVGIAGDGVWREHGRIGFTFLGGPGERGLDWRGLGCPELSLYMDGDERPLRVFAGATGESPVRMPFSICP